MSTNTTALIAGCLDGDAMACSELFESYKGLIYRTAYLMSGSNPQDAEDALQEVFMRVLAALHTYDPARGAFSTWLHRVTVNYCIAQNRTERRAPTVPIDVDTAGPGGDPLAIVGSEDEAALLLGALNDEQRVVAILRFYWDLSYKEIAEITGVELGTVQSRLGRAVRKMREAFDAAQEVG